MCTGTHVEGPFISPEMKGAHPEKYIQALQNGFQDLINTYHCMDSIVLITLAPEFPHSMEVIKKCVAQGITVSLGMI